MSQNIRHSSKNDSWLTPPDIVARGYEVFGGAPDLDPASSEQHNIFVRAGRIITREEDGLETPWRCHGLSVWMNPPGGLRGSGRKNTSFTGLFWRRLVAHRHEFKHAIVIGFNIELLRLSQQYSDTPVGHLPFIIPRKRTRFWKWDESGNLVVGTAPSHANVFVYVPGQEDHTEAFAIAFGDLGAVTVPR